MERTSRPNRNQRVFKSCLPGPRDLAPPGCRALRTIHENDIVPAPVRAEAAEQNLLVEREARVEGRNEGSFEALTLDQIADGNLAKQGSPPVVGLLRG